MKTDKGAQTSEAVTSDVIWKELYPNRTKIERQFMTTLTERIKSVSTWDSGGGIELDIVELADGRVLGISDEAVILYESMDDLEAGDASANRPFITL